MVSTPGYMGYPGGVSGATGCAVASSTWQEREQPSLSRRFPSSHCSLRPRSTMRSPQTGLLQSVRQASERKSEFPEPPSHCSPGSTLPLPQPTVTSSRRHMLLQASLGRVLPSSHSSPRRESTTPSPQEGFVQLKRQASAAVELLNAPVSHSSPESTVPLPQLEGISLVDLSIHHRSCGSHRRTARPAR